MAIEIGNQELIDTWASGGTIVEPDLTKKDQGWTLGEKPLFETMNFLQNQFGQKINYALRAGVPAHSTSTSYLMGDVVSRSGGIWIALADNTNSVPAAGNTNWLRFASLNDIPNANETTKGLIEHANQTEVNTGADGNLAVTPAKLRFGFASSLNANNGYIKFPSFLGGFILQWATGVVTTTGDQDQTINYPIAFPNAALHLMVSTRGLSSIVSDAWFQEKSFGNSSCVVVSQWSGTGNLSGGMQPKILVIGH